MAITPADVVNTKLLVHPVNWLIVWTVALFAGFAWALICEHVTNTSPNSPVV